MRMILIVTIETGWLGIFGVESSQTMYVGNGDTVPMRLGGGAVTSSPAGIMCNAD